MRYTYYETVYDIGGFTIKQRAIDLGSTKLMIIIQSLHRKWPHLELLEGGEFCKSATGIRNNNQIKTVIKRGVFRFRSVAVCARGK